MLYFCPWVPYISYSWCLVVFPCVCVCMCISTIVVIKEGKIIQKHCCENSYYCVEVKVFVFKMIGTPCLFSKAKSNNFILTKFKSFILFWYDIIICISHTIICVLIVTAWRTFCPSVTIHSEETSVEVQPESLTIRCRCQMHLSHWLQQQTLAVFVCLFICLVHVSSCA